MDTQSTQTCAKAHGPNTVNGIPAHEQDVAILNDHGKRVLSGDTDLELEPAKRASVNLQPKDNETYCEDCNIQFSRPYTFRRHREDIHGLCSTFSCNEHGCGKIFTRRDTLARHKDTQHGEGKVRCPECWSPVRKDGLRDHMSTNICRNNRPAVHDINLQDGDSANGRNEMRTSRKLFMRDTEHLKDERQAGSLCHDFDVMPDNRATASSDSIQIGMDKANENWVRISPAGNMRLDRSCISGFFPTPLDIQNVQLVPDSPRPIPDDDALSTLFLDDGKTAEELAQEIRILRGALEFRPSALATGPRATSTPPQFLVPVRRSYNMSLGSKCVLCGKDLGNDAKCVLQHAKWHLEYLYGSKLKCPVCKIAFAFEKDLRLHSSELELWSFCYEMPPIGAQDQDDWVAEACITARQSFIELLRRWETLQLHWYLAAVRKLLKAEYAGSTVKGAGSTAGSELKPVARNQNGSMSPLRRSILGSEPGSVSRKHNEFMSARGHYIRGSESDAYSRNDSADIESLNAMFSVTSVSELYSHDLRPQGRPVTPFMHLLNDRNFDTAHGNGIGDAAQTLGPSWVNSLSGSLAKCISGWRAHTTTK